MPITTRHAGRSKYLTEQAQIDRAIRSIWIAGGFRPAGISRDGLSCKGEPIGTL